MTGKPLAIWRGGWCLVRTVCREQGGNSSPLGLFFFTVNLSEEKQANTWTTHTPTNTPTHSCTSSVDVLEQVDTVVREV